MKDEELAKEWFDKELYLESSMYNMQIEYYCRQAFLAGLKAGRPQWHDLRKDPNDLPKDTVSVLISRGSPRTSRARYNGKWYGYYSDDEIEDVIAWCEIPVFGKE